MQTLQLVFLSALATVSQTAAVAIQPPSSTSDSKAVQIPAVPHGVFPVVEEATFPDFIHCAVHGNYGPMKTLPGHEMGHQVLLHIEDATCDFQRNCQLRLTVPDSQGHHAPDAFIFHMTYTNGNPFSIVATRTFKYSKFTQIVPMGLGVPVNCRE